FRRPDSDDEDYYPRSGGTSSFGSGGGSKKEALNRQLGEFKKNRFVTGSEQSQQEFYGKQEVKGDDGESGGGKKLTEDERNKIGAKILKAEMKGDKAAVARLKRKLEGGGGSDDERPSSSKTKEVVMMARDRAGNVMPARRKERDDDRHDRSSHSRVKREYGKDQNLNAMMKEEKTGTAEDQLRMFERALVSSSKIKRNDDESIDDIAEMQKGKRRHEEKDQKREEKKLRKHHSLLEKSLDDCALCIESRKLNKQCIVAVGITTYLCTAPWEGLDEEHLLIIPQAHCASSLQLDENVYEEMRLWRRGLVAMWKAAGRDCVFMEMARDVKANNHMYIECIPLEAELGDVAPVYFKKAINECEGEYMDNKKLIDLKDMRKQIPVGFNYFTIDFGLQNGYAHVIENRDAFPATFGTEILAGMMDLPPNRWRKRAELAFDEMKKRTNEVKKNWDGFDWTKRIRKDE
ncbi:hypothetical protein PFISCL1PPCAC_10878, partial [Pristionchus fissidentatus]